jgi:hypothetical protein
MAEQGIDAFRVMSVLGYCLLPIVGVGALSVVVTLECVCRFPYLMCADKMIQRIARLFILLSFRPLVHLLCFRDFRNSTPHVRPAFAGSVPRCALLRMLCALQRLQRSYNWEIDGIRWLIPHSIFKVHTTKWPTDTSPVMRRPNGSGRSVFPFSRFSSITSASDLLPPPRLI